MAGEDQEYVAWIRAQQCSMAFVGACQGAVQAHHAGQKGLSQRADDSTCVPLCMLHHKNWHDASGPFREMKKWDRREWAEHRIAYYTLLYASLLLAPEGGIPF